MDQELEDRRYARDVADAAIGLVFHSSHTEGCYNSFIISRYVPVDGDPFWDIAYSRMQAIMGISLKSSAVNDVLPIAAERLSSVRADVSQSDLTRIRRYAESSDMLGAMERIMKYNQSLRLIPKTSGALQDVMNHIRKQCRERGDYGYAPLKFEVPIQW